MGLRRINLDTVARTSLSDDDDFVLRTIFHSRLRIFLFVFGSIGLYVIFRTFPYLVSNDVMKSMAAVTAIVLFAVIPALLIFRHAVWAYYRDRKAGYKLVVYEEVIDKKYFPTTDQYFLCLEDVDYMHHEVEEETWKSTNIGDRYPVYFAAHSHYAFNLRGRVTMM